MELHETYPKQTVRNHCTIMAANGLLKLSIPVSRPQGSKTKTGDVRISSHEEWQARHWRSIASAYGKSPFFLYYEDLFRPLYENQPDDTLWKWNMRLLRIITGEFGIDTPVVPGKKFVARPRDTIDLREGIGTKKNLGQSFVVADWPRYNQTFAEKHGFKPNLSIIDLICNVGPDTRSYLEKAACSLRRQ